MDEPFIGSEAVNAGILRPHQLWSRRRGVLAGTTAAAWHGSKWADDRLPIALI
jgi:hypothetical protein